MSWANALAEEIKGAIGTKEIKEPIVLNAGLSVSGLQHVGRLRGEILIGSTLKKILEDEGYKTRQYLTLYTQDEWKGKDSQIRQFSDTGKGEKYKGYPLSTVPDPEGCHEGWVEHYWEPFGRELEKFVKGIETVTTSQLYRKKMKPYVKTVIKRKEEIIKILNKYREEKLSKDWTVFNPICEACGKIGNATNVHPLLDTYEVEYKCDCGYEGKESMEQGKLAWRVEWAAIWAALEVEFEAYGKDHAAPGGSRDTANEIVQKIFQRDPPLGTAYEWVAYEENGQERVMGSSDFIGFSPRTWDQFAEPEILNFLYLMRKPMKQITLNLQRIPQYARRFRNAEKIFFDKEKREDERLKVAYKYSFPNSPPSEFPFRISYPHAALFVQTIPESMDIQGIIERLKNQGIIQGHLLDREKELLQDRLHRARNWVQTWASERYKIQLIDKDQISERASTFQSLLGNQEEVISKLIREFERIHWNQQEIKDTMRELISPLSSDVTKTVFQSLYLTFLGKKRGPRIARYFTLLDKGLVLERLRTLQKVLKEK